MARPLRIQFEGALYHVISRGNEERDIFEHDRDKEKVIELLTGAYQRFGIFLHAYCIMENHYHFLMETPHANISKALQHINSSYNTYYQQTYGPVGHLFQGRFKAIIVDTEAYLAALNRYIHLNPVRAGIVRRPEEFEWSSYRYFFQDQGIPPFLNIDDTLNDLSQDRIRAREKFRLFIEEGIHGAVPDPMEKVVKQNILGGEQFVNEMIDLAEEQKNAKQGLQEIKIKPQQEDSAISKGGAALSPAVIEETVAKEPIEDKGLEEKVRMYLLRSFTPMTLKEIAATTGRPITHTAVSKAVKRLEMRRGEEKAVDALLRRIEAKVAG